MAPAPPVLEPSPEPVAGPPAEPAFEQLAAPPPKSEPARPPKPQPAARPPNYEPRADGGFGPLGSGGSNPANSRGYQAKGAWSEGSEDVEEVRERNRSDLRNGAGFRPSESGSEVVPQFLIEADDLYDDSYGENRLVAPPVLGEGPSNYRDF